MSADVLSPPGGARIRFGFPGLPESAVNPPWEEACLRVLFVRLSPFSDAVRSTPHTVLFAWMRTVLGPCALGDFAFLPAAWERRRLEEGRIPWMAGVQTGRPAAEFDALCVSCSVVQELPNLPLMLLRAGIPPRASSRRAGPSFSEAPWPPVLLGGSSAALSRGLFFPDGDSFADGLYFGEIEPHAQDFFRTLLETRGAGADAVAGELARRIPAFRAVIPGDPLPDGQDFVPGTARSLVPWEQPASVVFDAPSADTVKLEISRGCPAFCSFCHEAWERRPYRELPADAVLETARRLARETGASTVEVAAFNFNTHQEIGRLLDGLHRIFDRVNLMSQRADVLARHPWMLQAELAAEKRSFTVGVEGISRRMRRFYAKGFLEDAWRELLDDLAKARVREIKLFFILAGIEGEADLAEFETFCGQLRDVLKKRSHAGVPRVVFSAGFLVRMPQTPLMFAKPEFARPRMEYLARRMEKAVSAAGFEFRMAMSWEEYVLSQVLVLSTPRTASILEESARQGWVCDGRIPRELVERLLEDFRTSRDALPLSPEAWGDAALVRAWEQAAGFEEPSVCCASLVADGQTGCHGCGACRDAAERAFLTGHSIRRDAALAASLAEWVRSKRRSRPIHLRIVVPERFSGVSREYLEANLLAAALCAFPELTGRLFGIREALWTHPAWEVRVGAGWSGSTVVALYGVSGAMPDGSPCLAARDVQDAAAALEGFLGSAVRVMERFDASEVSAVRALVGWNSDSAQAIFTSVRGWLSELKVAFTERRLPAADAPSGEARTFDIAPRDRRKMESVVCRVVPEEGFVRAELRMEGGRRWEPAPLLRILGADCHLCRIEDFTLPGG